MKKMIWKILLLFLILAGIFLYNNYRKNAGIRFVNSMGSGINVGNTLDATKVRKIKKNASIEYYETYWNNPLITKELINMLKEAGFGTVRIPVSWDEHMDEEGMIEDEWMNRVEEVVTYGLEAGLYVILDTHHESWLIPLPKKEKETRERLGILWHQIAKRFIDYPEKLLFEGMNEPRTIDSEDEWRGGTKEEREVINRLNTVFIETVRNTGGKNEGRWLIITTYGSNARKEALEALEIPKEDNKIIVNVHAYTPYSFTQDIHGVSEWSADNKEDTESIFELMERLDKYFIQKNIPVLLTEFGCIDKNNLEDRVTWVCYYTKEAKKNKVGYIWWDNGDEYSLMDRENYSWKFPELVEKLTR